MKIDLTEKEREWILETISGFKSSCYEGVVEKAEETDNNWNEDDFDEKHSEFMIWKSLWKKLNKEADHG